MHLTLREANLRFSGFSGFSYWLIFGSFHSEFQFSNCISLINNPKLGSKQLKWTNWWQEQQMENSKAICPPQQEGTKKRFCIVNRGETTMLCIQGWVFKKPHLVRASPSRLDLFTWLWVLALFRSSERVGKWSSAGPAQLLLPKALSAWWKS